MGVRVFLLVGVGIGSKKIHLLLHVRIASTPALNCVILLGVALYRFRAGINNGAIILGSMAYRFLPVINYGAISTRGINRGLQLL